MHLRNWKLYCGMRLHRLLLVQFFFSFSQLTNVANEFEEHKIITFNLFPIKCRLTKISLFVPVNIMKNKSTNKPYKE